MPTKNKYDMEQLKPLLEAMKIGAKDTAKRVDDILNGTDVLDAQTMMFLCINCQALRDLSNTIFSKWKRIPQQSFLEQNG